MERGMIRLALLIASTLALAAVRVGAAPLTDADKQFLSGYEKIHLALAADDLPGAASAAKELGDEGGDIIKAKSLAEARTSYEKLSAKAKGLITGQSGYYLVHCPMLKKDWVQTSTTITNPYAGKAMVSCGEIKK
ncbi:MAG: hypothetical protein QOH88_1578 [Verrucomicrobiota bacterium]